VRFECLENCGRCCRGVSVSQEFFEAHRPNIPFRVNKRGHYVHKNADICIWLDKSRRCILYNKRPQQCKDFATHEKAKTLDGYKCAFMEPDGTRRTRDEEKRILNMIMPTLKKPRFIMDSEFREVWPDG